MVRVRICLCKMVYIGSDKNVLYSKAEECLCIQRKKSTREMYYIKTTSEEIWDCKFNQEIRWYSMSR